MKKVILGLSGGVDSSVAMLVLKEQGYNVEGLFMRNWDSALNNDILGNPELNDDVCPQEKDYQDAKAVAEHLNLPLLRVDFIKEYWDNVFSYFLDEYKKGRTPNPDIMCNKYIKFDAFLKVALEHNADYIAMGHYARVKHFKDHSILLRGVDSNKDQTYFLCMLNQAQLQKTLFPIGDLLKSDVRRIALENNIPTAKKKDSTGICFIGERHFKEFLQNYLPAKPGNMVTLDHKILGKHDGLMYYTIGQRKGLGIGGLNEYDNDAWFVVGKNLKTNELLVGQGYNNPYLMSNRLIATDLNLIYDDLEENKTYGAKFRYRQQDVPVTVKKLTNNKVEVYYEPTRAVTPGQAVVFYDGEVCLGGAIIDKVYMNDEERMY